MTLKIMIVMFNHCNITTLDEEVQENLEENKNIEDISIEKEMD
jgi:hypothetical protein